jgi:hypothetical protein
VRGQSGTAEPRSILYARDPNDTPSLCARGEQVLRNRGLVVHESPLLKKGRMGACRQFAHQLMICDCLASIELDAALEVAEKVLDRIRGFAVRSNINTVLIPAVIDRLVVGKLPANFGIEPRLVRVRSRNSSAWIGFGSRCAVQPSQRLLTQKN